MLIALGSLPGLGAAPVLALPGDPLDPKPIGPPRRFIPPPNGFRWDVNSRFGQYRDGMIDFHWDAAAMQYDPEHVDPSRFPVNLDGCRTAEEAESGLSVNAYRWDLNGETITGNRCAFTYGFLAQGAYTVRLAITDPAGNPVPAGRTPTYFEQTVTVRDYLIVSIGDSFASGEANPDIPQRVRKVLVNGQELWVQDAPPRWQDQRCHRSALAGPAQAALAVEAASPKSSVTFLSFACSGATINTTHWDGHDPHRSVGTGILGKYRGIEPPLGTPYDDGAYITAQIEQVDEAIGNRRIDALIISGGGNDIHFGGVAQACLTNDMNDVTAGDCWRNPLVMVAETPGNPFPLEMLVNRALGRTSSPPSNNLPANYDRLAAAIGEKLNVAKVYITEYPDLTRDDNGGYCRMLDDILWPNPNAAIIPSESQTASQFALSQLNLAARAAATRHGWSYVSGIYAEFVSDSFDHKGHGYCASDNWIRRADESVLIQGPVNLRALTTGTLHPTARGHQVYSKRLVEAILPDLNPGTVLPPLPSFSTRLTDGTVTSRQGANGWLTGRCVGSTCTSGAVVLQTIAYAPDRLTDASLAVNGVAGCTVIGVTCGAPTLSADRKTLTWTITIARDGLYRLQFAVRDSGQQVATFTHEAKVDLRDPTATATIPPGLPTSGGAYTTPVDVTLSGSDPADGSGVAAIEYRLDGGAPALVAPGGAVRVNVGDHSLAYRAFDGAGRASAAQTLAIRVAPTASLAGDKDNFGTNTPAGTAIRLVDMVHEPDDGDFDEQGRWCGQQFFRWSHAYAVPAGATVKSAKLTVVSWNLRDGNLVDGRQYYDTTLFLDGQEVVRAFDTVVSDVTHHLVPGHSNTTVFHLAPALLPSLSDGRLDVMLDAYAGGTLQCFAIDYGELELVFDDATRTNLKAASLSGGADPQTEGTTPAAMLGATDATDADAASPMTATLAEAQVVDGMAAGFHIIAVPPRPTG